jgi:hypothetical protein
MYKSKNVRNQGPREHLVPNSRNFTISFEKKRDKNRENTLYEKKNEVKQVEQYNISIKKLKVIKAAKDPLQPVFQP